MATSMAGGMYLAGMPTLAVSAVGLDRPGIIAAVAERLAAHGANITDSRMAILRGHFALTLIVEGAERGGLRAGARPSGDRRRGHACARGRGGDRLRPADPPRP